MRDNDWLNLKLNQIWQAYFPDLQKKNNVNIKFKGKWRYKLGHIRKQGKDTEIAINGLFKNLKVPEHVVTLIIAHELVHYSHGFNSPLKKQFKYPHKGNIVKKELISRGFNLIIKQEQEFIKKQWPKIYEEIHKS